MNVYDTYGLKSQNLEEVKKQLEEFMKIDFEEHDSSYMGGIYYSAGKATDEHFVLHRNYCEEEGWTEENYEEFDAILKVNESQRANELRQLLLNNFQEKITFIERIKITGDRRYQRYKYVDGRDELTFEKQLS